MVLSVAQRQHWRVPQTLQERFGQRVRKLRQERGWTQEDMADRLGLDRAYISHLERGTKNVCLPTMQVLAQGLGVTLAKLLERV